MGSHLVQCHAIHVAATTSYFKRVRGLQNALTLLQVVGGRSIARPTKGQGHRHPTLLLRLSRATSTNSNKLCEKLTTAIVNAMQCNTGFAIRVLPAYTQRSQRPIMVCWTAEDPL